MSSARILGGIALPGLVPGGYSRTRATAPGLLVRVRRTSMVRHRGFASGSDGMESSPGLGALLACGRRGVGAHLA